MTQPLVPEGIFSSLSGSLAKFLLSQLPASFFEGIARSILETLKAKTDETANTVDDLLISMLQDALDNHLTDIILLVASLLGYNLIPFEGEGDAAAEPQFQLSADSPLALKLAETK
jgi:hypothetical protein